MNVIATPVFAIYAIPLVFVYIFRKVTP